MPKLRAIVRQPVAVVVLLVLFAVTAHAASITLFTSRDEFMAQFPNPQIFLNFSGFPEGVPDTPGYLRADGVTIIGDFRVSDGAINFTSLSGGPFEFAFNFNGNRASYFGADIVGVSGPGVLVSSFGLSAAYNFTSSRQFFGVSSDVPFEEIRFRVEPGVDTGPFTFVINNITANIVGVPEPSTLLLLGAGAVIGLVRLYTRRRPPADGHLVGEGESSDAS
jgi:hypothetical protein